MTAVSPSQFAGTGSDNEALFLKMYMDSYVAAPRAGILLAGGPGDRFIKRIRPASGKSHQFLMFGEVPDAEEFEPGSELLGQVMAIDEGTITSDGYVVCHKWIGKDKMDMSHFDVLPQLAERHKSRIERLYDRRAMITAATGARSTSAVSKNGLNIHNGANRVTRTSSSTLAIAYAQSATGAANLRADLRQLGFLLDRDHIAAGPQNRALILDPYLRTVLSYDNTGQVFSKDYVTTSDQMRHEVEVLERFSILGYANPTSANGPLPDENIVTGPTRYQGNFSSASGLPGVLCFSRSMEGEYGLGIVEFESVTHVVKWFQEKLAWLVMTYARQGCNVMHPWALGCVDVTA